MLPKSLTYNDYYWKYTNNPYFNHFYFYPEVIKVSVEINTT